MNEQGRYLTESVPAAAQALTGIDGDQTLVALFSPTTDPAVPSRSDVRLVLPRINIYNIALRARVAFTVRWAPARVSRQPIEATGSVHPWDNAYRARPGSTFRFGIEGTAPAKTRPAKEAP